MIFDTEQGQFNGEKRVFLTNCAGTIGLPYAKQKQKQNQKQENVDRDLTPVKIGKMVE